MLQKELESRILHGISCEWENLLLILPQEERKRMKAPLFSVRDIDSRWGYWRRDKREIALSRHLVLHHSWDAVREVLLHEIAHQYADEVFDAHNETPHGPLFVKACHMLRANPKASGNFKPLDERLSSITRFSEDIILRRVRKLMALAESQNQYEAEAAMAKAQELMKKYNQNILAEDRERDFTSVFLGKPALRHTRKDYTLAHLLQDFYFVKGIWMPAFVLEKSKMGRVLEISGTYQNINTACYVYDFVCHFIQSQWEEYNKDKEYNKYRKIDFAVGIVEGFRSKLRMQKEENEKPLKHRALVKIEDPLLTKYFDYKYPHTMKVRRKASQVDKNVLKDGIGIGRKLVIFKGIKEEKQSKGLFLIEN